MSNHLIKVTTDNFDTSLERGADLSKRGAGVGFDLSALDAVQRLSFNSRLKKLLHDGRASAVPKVPMPC